MKNNLIEQVLKTVRNYELLKPGDTVLAAVSGGPDSIFLLHALARLKNKLSIKKLAVCNLDHGLRAKESEEDSDFVKNCAKEAGLEYVHKKIDLKAAKSKTLSVEEVAREARYKFFKEAAARTGAMVIATGHTLDDQAETVLMRIIKGSSLKGIVGISPIREEAGIRIIRPLIQLEKSEITRYLDDAGISYRIDSSNLESKFFRNVVRGEIIPFLERYNPRFKRALFNLAEHLREDFDFIENEKARARQYTTNMPDGEVEIELKDIAVQPRTIQKEILRDCLERAGGEVKKLSFRHWKEVEALIKHKRKGNCVDLPGSIRVLRQEKSILFKRI